MLEAYNLTKKFGKNEPVLKYVSEVFGRGITGIYGLNGSGKSVLLRLFSGTYLPDAGEVRYNGVNISKIRNYPEKFCYINSETRNLYERLTGIENISFYEALLGRSVNNNPINYFLKKLNLEGNIRKPVSSFSSGMKQKLVLAINLSRNTGIMLLDEFTDHLDDEAIGFLKSYIMSIKSTRIIIYVTKNTNNIFSFCDKKMTIKDGGIF